MDWNKIKKQLNDKNIEYIEHQRSNSDIIAEIILHNKQSIVVNVYFSWTRTPYPDGLLHIDDLTKIASILPECLPKNNNFSQLEKQGLLAKMKSLNPFLKNQK